MNAFRHEVHFGRVSRCFRDRPSDIDTMFRDAVRVGQIALIDSDRNWTYVELDSFIDNLTQNLVQRGLGTGARIAAMLDNGAAFLALALACARVGAIFVPIGIRHKASEVEHMLRDCAASAIVFEPALADQVPDVSGLAIRAELGGPEWRALTDAPSQRVTLAAPAEDDPFCILYTSGTTGKPKGAVLTHLGVLHSCLHFAHHLELKRGDVAALAVPASHVTGLVAILLTAISVAGATVILRDFKARAFLAAVETQGVSFTIMVPAMYRLCLMEPAFDQTDLRSWRVGGFGGAPMPVATIDELAVRAPGLKLFNCYGATETSSPAVISRHGQAASHPDALGVAVACADIRVMDEHGREAAPGESGEIWISGPMVIPGYWNNPVANEAAFMSGYWRSGDVGSIDEAGLVRLLDRKKDVINRGGYKVYSAEVENELLAHPHVVEAAVVARACPVLGERVVAFVRLSGAAAEQDLRAFCAARLADYKTPESVIIVDAPLPRNANGKLLKTVMRDWAAQA